MRRHGGDGIDTGRSDDGVLVPEATKDCGDHLGEEGREGITMSVREEHQKMHALLADRRLGGGVSVVKATEEGREGVVGEGSGNGLELSSG